MDRIPLSLAVCDYDRTKALFLGRAPIEGCDVLPFMVEAEEAFHRAFKFQEFDVTELSLSSHTIMTSRGDNAYVGIPAFVSRVFRHSGIYIRTDRGIRKPEDLKGKRVGVPEYQLTANVWIRGILADDYGVRAEDILWRRGGIEEPGRGERAPINLPAGVRLEQIPDDKTLSGMLADGEIDAMFSARSPSCFDRKAQNVGRLFPDSRPVEEDYYRRTGFFPIMHLIGIRRTLVEKHPWLAVNVFKAFLDARRLAHQQFSEIGFLHVSLPWSGTHYEETRRLMGADFWPYGLERNLKELETFTRYSYEQGLSVRKVSPAELFAHTTLDLSKR